ncbi:hypothetical protein ACU8MB_16260 [Rhizobium leguminosarum]
MGMRIVSLAFGLGLLSVGATPAICAPLDDKLEIRGQSIKPECVPARFEGRLKELDLLPALPETKTPLGFDDSTWGMLRQFPLASPADTPERVYSAVKSMNITSEFVHRWNPSVDRIAAFEALTDVMQGPGGMVQYQVDIFQLMGRSMKGLPDDQALAAGSVLNAALAEVNPMMAAMLCNEFGFAMQISGDFDQGPAPLGHVSNLLQNVGAELAFLQADDLKRLPDVVPETLGDVMPFDFKNMAFGPGSVDPTAMEASGGHMKSSYQGLVSTAAQTEKNESLCKAGCMSAWLVAEVGVVEKSVEFGLACGPFAEVCGVGTFAAGSTAVSIAALACIDVCTKDEKKAQQDSATGKCNEEKAAPPKNQVTNDTGGAPVKTGNTGASNDDSGTGEDDTGGGTNPETPSDTDSSDAPAAQNEGASSDCASSGDTATNNQGMFAQDDGFDEPVKAKPETDPGFGPPGLDCPGLNPSAAGDSWRTMFAEGHDPKCKKNCGDSNPEPLTDMDYYQLDQTGALECSGKSFAIGRPAAFYEKFGDHMKFEFGD